MLDNVSDTYESPRDIRSFIKRLEKRKSNTGKVDHSPEEKRNKLDEQHEKHHDKNLSSEQNKSKDSFRERTEVHQSNITKYYRTVKGSLYKQNSTKKKRNWDSFSSDEEFWIPRYAIKSSRSTGDVSVSDKTKKCDKDHKSLPIIREEVRRDVSLLSKAMSPNLSVKKDKYQVLAILKKRAKEKRKASQQVKSASKNIDLNHTIVHKSQVNDNIMHFQRRKAEDSSPLCEVDTSNRRETGHTSISNARPEKNISDIIEDMERKKSTIQLCDKNCIDEKQKVKEILDKLVKEGMDENKIDPYVKDISQNLDTTIITHNKIEKQVPTFSKESALSQKHNQKLDQKNVNNIVEHMLDQPWGSEETLEETLSKGQNPNKCDVGHEQLQTIFEKLSRNKQPDVVVSCKDDATCAKGRNKIEFDSSNELPKPLGHKILDESSIIKMLTESVENNQDKKENGYNKQHIENLFEKSEKLIPTAKADTSQRSGWHIQYSDSQQAVASKNLTVEKENIRAVKHSANDHTLKYMSDLKKMDKCTGNVQNAIQCYTTSKEVLQKKRNMKSNKEESPHDQGSENHIFSKTINARATKSIKYIKSDTSHRTYIKGKKEMHKLISKLKGQTEEIEQGREEMHQLIIKLTSQTEEIASINNKPKHQEGLLDVVEKNCSDSERHVARETDTDDVKNPQDLDVQKSRDIFQIYHNSDTSEGTSDPDREKIDKRKSSQLRKPNSSKTGLGQQLTLLHIFNKVDSKVEQDNPGSLKKVGLDIEEEAEYNQKQDIINHESPICHKSRNQESSKKYTKIFQEIDSNSNIPSELNQESDGSEKTNSDSEKCDKSSSQYINNIGTLEENQLLKKRKEVDRCNSKQTVKTENIHTLDIIFNEYVANRQQTKNLIQKLKSQPEIRKNTPNSSGTKLGELSVSSEDEGSVVQNSKQNVTSTMQYLIKKEGRKKCDKSNNLTRIYNTEMGKDGIHGILRRLTTTSGYIKVNTDHSSTKKSYPSPSVLQNNEVRKDKTIKRSVNGRDAIEINNTIIKGDKQRAHEAVDILQKEKFITKLNINNFGDTEIGDSVSNLEPNFKNSFLENVSDHILVHCFQSGSKIINIQSSNEEQKKYLQNNDEMKSTPENTSESIKFDPLEKCSDRSFNNIFKVLEGNASDNDKSAQKENETPIMNQLGKLKTNSSKDVIRSAPVYSQNQVTIDDFKCFTEQNRKKSVQEVSQTGVPAKSKAMPLNKVSDQEYTRNNTFKEAVNNVLKQPTKHPEKSRNMKFANTPSNSLDDVKPDVKKNANEALKISLIEFWKQIKQFDNGNLEVQNTITDVSSADCDNSTIDTTVVVDNQQSSVDKIVFELSSRKSDKRADCSCRSLSKTNSNVSISEDIKRREINLERENEVQLESDSKNPKKNCEKSCGSDCRTTESPCTIDQMESRNLLLKVKHNFAVNSFDKNKENEAQSKGNIIEHQIINNMLYERTCHESESQSVDFRNPYICSSRSVTNFDIDVEAESCVDICKTDTQHSKAPFNHPFNSPGEDISEEFCILDSIFLQKLSDTSQLSKCVLGDQNYVMANYDLSNPSLFEPECGNPIQTRCIHEKNEELPIGKKVINDESNNVIENCYISNTSLSTAESQYREQIRTTSIPDKNEQKIMKEMIIPEKSQTISRKANRLLDDELVNTILTKNYEQCMISKENNPRETPDDFVAKLLEKTEGKKQKVKGVVKKYRKGKVKIYRLKKNKKVRKNIEKGGENLDFEDVFKKLTQDFQEPDKCSSPCETFVSTPSSFISVETLRSETLSTGSKELNSPQRRLRHGFNKISKDKSLLHSENTSEHLSALDRDEIKIKIQDIFLQIFNDLTNGRRAALKFRRQCYKNCILKDGRLQLKPEGEALESVLSSSVTRSHMNFKLVICLMKKIQVLLETNSKLTKRELYYQLKDMINGQGVVDRAINLVSCLLNVGMWALNIIAQKGLIFGNLKILLSSGETINCNVPGTLIPQDINDIVEIHSDAYFILVVEKEAIFQKLLEEDIPNKLTRPFIMITGKGFPDLNTQLFLRKLWIIMRIPVFILVDADPHGINIMLNYRFGSVANAHVSHHLAVPKARWLGLFPSEMTMFNVKKQAMTTNEQKMVEKLLNTPYMNGNPGIVEELKILKQNNVKAGIEGLIKTDVFLSQVYLPYKFLHRNFI